jgi:hypothetical protein
MRCAYPLAGPLVTGALLLGLMPQGAAAAGGTVVISQVYGGGGNVGATYLNDFIELHNRSSSTVDITNWAIQSSDATSMPPIWSLELLPSTTIPAGRYFLIQEGGEGGNGAALPTPDMTGSTDLGTTAGRIAVTNSSTVCPYACSSAPNIVDFVGYGGAALDYEGSGPAPSPSKTTADFRGNGGDFGHERQRQ